MIKLHCQQWWKVSTALKFIFVVLVLYWYFYIGLLYSLLLPHCIQDYITYFLHYIYWINYFSD